MPKAHALAHQQGKLRHEYRIILLTSELLPKRLDNECLALKTMHGACQSTAPPNALRRYPIVALAQLAPATASVAQ